MLPLRPAAHSQNAAESSARRDRAYAAREIQGRGKYLQLADTNLMTKTYIQIQKQIETLQREADKLRRKEVDDVVAKIKEAIAVYGISAADLGFSGRSGAGAVAAKRRGRPAAAKGRSKSASAPKYRDEAGNTWGGRGPRPQWLRDALNAGKSLADFAV